jgi:hypothetical protein
MLLNVVVWDGMEWTSMDDMKNVSNDVVEKSEEKILILKT